MTLNHARKLRNLRNRLGECEFIKDKVLFGYNGSVPFRRTNNSFPSGFEIEREGHFHSRNGRQTGRSPFYHTKQVLKLITRVRINSSEAG